LHVLSKIVFIDISTFVTHPDMFTLDGILFVNSIFLLQLARLQAKGVEVFSMTNVNPELLAKLKHREQCDAATHQFAGAVVASRLKAMAANDRVSDLHLTLCCSSALNFL